MSANLPDKSIKYNSLGEISQVANWAVKSGLFGVRSADEAAVKILYGVEMGLPTFQALTSLNLIQGKVTMAANLMASLIKRSGRYNYVIRAWDETQCVIDFSDNGQAAGSSSFTMVDAKKAGLVRGGGGWDKYPKAMLFARAISQGARAYCADVFCGPVYDPEELTPDTRNSDVKPEVVSVPVAEAPTPELSRFAVLPAPVEKQVHPLKIELSSYFGSDKQAIKNAVVKIYEVAARNGLVDGSTVDEKVMYAELVGVIDRGKLSIEDVRLIISSDDAIVVEEVEEDDAADTGAE
jgi:hypothetical protein